MPRIVRATFCMPRVWSSSRDRNAIRRMAFRSARTRGPRRKPAPTRRSTDPFGTHRPAARWCYPPRIWVSLGHWGQQQAPDLSSTVPARFHTDQRYAALSERFLSPDRGTNQSDSVGPNGRSGCLRKSTRHRAIGRTHGHDPAVSGPGTARLGGYALQMGLLSHRCTQGVVYGRCNGHGHRRRQALDGPEITTRPRVTRLPVTLPLLRGTKIGPSCGTRA